MIGEVVLSDLERDILLTAMDGRSRGEDAIEFVPGVPSEVERGRRALATLVLRNLLAWTGKNTYRLTEEGALTATALLTRVTA